MYTALFIISVIMFGYLMYVLVKPEKFQSFIKIKHNEYRDIRLLTEAFVQSLSEKMTHSSKTVSKAFIDMLEQQEWKGNVRELRNVIERSLIVCESDELHPEDLPIEIQNAAFKEKSCNNSGFELSAMEKRHIARVLDYTNGNKTETAKLLKIGLTTLYRKIEEYKL